MAGMVDDHELAACNSLVETTSKADELGVLGSRDDEGRDRQSVELVPRRRLLCGSAPAQASSKALSGI